MHLPLSVKSEQVPQSTLIFLHDRIIQIVGERSGIKETELTIDIMADFTIRDFYFDPITIGISAEVIFTEIHQLIRQGRIIGIDCEIGDAGYTFLVPAGTKIKLAMPIQSRHTTH